jgi:hypothetical protein
MTSDEREEVKKKKKEFANKLADLIEGYPSVVLIPVLIQECIIAFLQDPTVQATGIDGLMVLVEHNWSVVVNEFAQSVDKQNLN